MEFSLYMLDNNVLSRKILFNNIEVFNTDEWYCFKLTYDHLGHTVRVMVNENIAYINGINAEQVLNSVSFVFTDVTKEAFENPLYNTGTRLDNIKIYADEELIDGSVFGIKSISAVDIEFKACAA